jgi:hypothetical protein
MLHDFVAAYREELICRCRAKVRGRSVLPPASSAELQHGIPKFLDQLVDALQSRLEPNREMDRSAARHGHDLQLQGFTVAQVVHDYGDVCQSITDLAVETGAPISVEDFRTLNRCLDDAIASAVTEYAREPLPSGGDTGALGDQQRFELFAHEIRNLVNNAGIAFEVLNTGNVGVRGSIGSLLKRSLSELRGLINRSIAEVQLRQGIQDRVHSVIAERIEDLAPAAALEAAGRGLQFTSDAWRSGGRSACLPPDRGGDRRDSASKRGHVHPSDERVPERHRERGTRTRAGEPLSRCSEVNRH